jgi:branched-subunit amino acid ABC-type transport system permease component
MQLFVDGIVSGTVCALVGCSFALLYRVAGFFNFSFGASYLVAGYTLLWTKSHTLIPDWLAAVLGIVAAGSLTLVLEIWLFRPMRRIGMGPVALFIASLGFLFFVAHIVGAVFGDYPVRPWGTWQPVTFFPIGLRVTTGQLTIVVLGLVQVILLIGMERIRPIGVLLRAVADDSDLATDLGLPVNKALNVASLLGGFLAGSAAVLFTLEFQLRPSDGQSMLFLAFAATVLGGRLSFLGVLIGGLMVGMIRNYGVFYFGNRYEDLIVYGLLLAALLVRPAGVGGYQSVTASLR